MKLRNKKTGEIVRIGFLTELQNEEITKIGFIVHNTNITYLYNSLAELNEDWEDYDDNKNKDRIKPKFGYLINKNTGYVISFDEPNKYYTFIREFGDEWIKCNITIDKETLKEIDEKGDSI